MQINTYLKTIQRSPSKYIRSNSGPDFEKATLADLLGFYSDYPKKQFEKQLSDLGMKDGLNNELDSLHDRADFISHGGKLAHLSGKLIMHPRGSQKFPEYIIINDTSILPIEMKFTKDGNKPFGNGGLPKSQCLYILGTNKDRDATFFMGDHILSGDEKLALQAEYDALNGFKEDYELAYKEDLENERGFTVYLRKTFMQEAKKSKYKQLSYFEYPDRKVIERETIEAMERFVK